MSSLDFVTNNKGQMNIKERIGQIQKLADMDCVRQGTSP